MGLEIVTLTVKIGTAILVHVTCRLRNLWMVLGCQKWAIIWFMWRSLPYVNIWHQCLSVSVIETFFRPPICTIVRCQNNRECIYKIGLCLFVDIIIETIHCRLWTVYFIFIFGFLNFIVFFFFFFLCFSVYSLLLFKDQSWELWHPLHHYLLATWLF